MVLIDTLILGRYPSGIGVYTLNLVRALTNYLDFTILTHAPELFGLPLRYKVAPKILDPDAGKSPAFLRLLYLQSLRGKGVLYRTYHSISLFWSGKQVITIHDVLPVLFPERYPQQSFMFKYFLKPFIQRVDYVITVSENSKRDILEVFRIPEHRVKVFYQGYDSNIFKPDLDHTEVELAKRRLGLRNYLIMVGAQFSHKNAEIVIRALREIDSSIQLLITGTKDPYESQIKTLVSELNLEDRVIIKRYISQKELPHLYAGSIALVFPSKYEGFGIPILEAMAVGTPIIGTMAVKEAGGDAILYADPDDVDSWVACVQTAMNKRDYLVRKGLERVKSFSWQKTAKNIAKFIKELEH